MGRIRVVTDSACDLPQADVERYGITVVPLVVVFGKEEYPDRFLPPEQYWAKAAQVHPQTSQPSPGAFAAAYRPIIEAGDDVFCITITGKHSGTYNTAMAAAAEFPPGRVTVFDSLSLSQGQGVQVVQAARLAEEGASAEEIVRHLRDLQKRIHIFIVLDTLEYLERGGRAAALMPVVKRVAQALNIKPIVNLVEGELKLVSAARSYERGLSRLVQEAVARAPWESVGVLHARAPQAAEKVADRLAEETGFPRSSILVMETGSVLSSHGGPGVLGTIVVTQKASPV